MSKAVTGRTRSNRMLYRQTESLRTVLWNETMPVETECTVGR